MNKCHLIDNMKFMLPVPTKFFDLAIVDPPYGIGISLNPFRQKQTKKEWDKSIPTKEYFIELMRISKNQIIWGGNYFNLPPSQGFVIWDKKQPETFSSSMCEMAWMSIQAPAKIFRLHVVTAETNKINPCQKPVKLYKWLLKNYAKPNDKIFDSHVGSGSIRIACHDMGFDFTGCEIDKDYWEAQEKRFQNHIKQNDLFLPEELQVSMLQGDLL